MIDQGDEAVTEAVTAVTDGARMPWRNGVEVIESFAPEWRANLGSAEAVTAAYRLFNTKVFYENAETGQRFELVRCEAGYEDQTTAFHDTVEECFCLTGAVILEGEGDMGPGTYFWRPPGFVHRAVTPPGFSALLMCEGVSPEDGSGPVTRRIRDASEVGTNALETDMERAVGPRGFVRNVDSALLAWIPGTEFARGQATLEGYDLERAEFKVLSSNASTGGQSLLIRLLPGYAQAGRHMHTGAQLVYVLEGELRWNERTLGAGTFIHRPARTPEPPFASPGGALLFAKIGSWLDYIPA